MAFTKTPTQDSAQTKTVPLLYKWDSRDGSQNSYDTLLQNALVEPVGEEYFHLLKRDGSETISVGADPDRAVVGIYFWAATGNLVVVEMGSAGTGAVYNIDGIFQKTFVGTITTLTTADQEVGFTEFLYQNGNIALLICVQGQLYQLLSGVLTAVNIAAIAGGPVLNSVVFLDGYAFLQTNTAIWNSNLNDPTTWTASNFLAVDSYPDVNNKLTRVGPYLVSLGADSVQYFYDAANPTGTPLAANVGATKRIGYLGGFANFGDDVLFVGTANQSTPSLYRISGLKIEPVASFPFSRMWNVEANRYDTRIAQAGSILNLNGHNMYFVRTPADSYTFPDIPVTSPTGVSYLYDLDTGMWSKMAYQGATNFLIKQAVTYSVSSTVPNNPGQPRLTYFIRLGSANVFRFNPSLYQDSGVNFSVQFRTKPFDFGTFRMKFGGRLLVQGDQTNTSSLAFISWSDDDYKTTSTPRSVDMQYAYQQLYALGSFRKRSWTLTYSDNFPMRWRVIELDYEQGTA